MEEQRKTLGWLVGDWLLDVEYQMPDGSIVRGTGTAYGEPDELSQGVRLKLDAFIEGMDDLDEEYLISHRTEDGLLHLYNLSLEGDQHDHVGKWIESYGLEFCWSGTVDGEPTEEHVDFNWVGPDELQIREVDSIGGAPQMEATYLMTRQ